MKVFRIQNDDFLTELNSALKIIKKLLEKCRVVCSKSFNESETIYKSSLNLAGTGGV